MPRNAPSQVGPGLRLPGDIRIERDGYSFYFPITTGIIVSIVLSLLLTLIDWIFRK